MTALAAERASKRPAAEPALLVWCGVFLFSALCLLLKSRYPWLVTFPSGWTLPLAGAINTVTDSIVPVLQPAFRAVSAMLDWPMRSVRQGLLWFPWPAVMLATAALALRAGGIRLAIFAILALAYMLVAGYWPQSMSTLSLVILAVPISAAAGFGLGVLGYRHRRIKPALVALLDLMQTVPAFAYLIPLLLLFGFGPVVGLIASAIYATPPMVRNTMLGLEHIPEAISEAGLMSGCTRRQQFWHVEIPTAMPQILVGFNQTTMAALSMVIIAAIIGGFEDIGWEVLSSMRKAEFGQSILSGLVIALLAILIDRTTLGFARAWRHDPANAARASGRWWLAALVLAVVLAVAIRLMWAEGTLLPQTGLRSHAGAANRWLLGLVRDYGWLFDGIRNSTLYGLLLPLRVGISGAATPAIWGFSLTPPLAAAYVATFLSTAMLLAWRFGWRPAVALLLAGLLLYTGFLGLPWPVFILTAAVIGYQVSGVRLALFAAGGFGAMLLAGLWGRSPSPFTCACWRCCSALSSAGRSEPGRPTATVCPPCSSRSATRCRPCRNSSS